MAIGKVLSFVAKKAALAAKKSKKATEKSIKRKRNKTSKHQVKDIGRTLAKINREFDVKDAKYAKGTKAKIRKARAEGKSERSIERLKKKRENKYDRKIYREQAKSKHPLGRKVGDYDEPFATKKEFYDYIRDAHRKRKRAHGRGGFEKRRWEVQNKVDPDELFDKPAYRKKMAVEYKKRKRTGDKIKRARQEIKDAKKEKIEQRERRIKRIRMWSKVNKEIKWH